MNDPKPHATWFDDVHRIVDVVRETSGLPLPCITGIQAAFHFTDIVHAQDAARAVVRAETVLTCELGLTFEPRDTPRIGSAEHYILSAYMLSGLRVDIVAKAGIFDGPGTREDARKLTGAAA
jgi:hypothetical protein